MLILKQNALNAKEILNKWYDEYRFDYGAFIPFVGIIRNDDNIDGLSFNIKEDMLKEWFNEWIQKAKEKNSLILMAHSIGDVKVYETSFIAAVFSKHRQEAFELIEEFVEDFKANAPIWKYDLKNNKRIFALNRSKKLPNAGLLK